MESIFAVLLTVAIPMAVVQLLYKIIDRKGRLTLKLAEKAPFLKNHRYIVQIGGTVGFILVFGIVSWICGLDSRIYFSVSGAATGLINGMSVAIMSSD